MTHTRSDGMVFFGATGDLAFKQVFPALQALTKKGRLKMPVVAVGRKEMRHDEIVAHMKKSLAASSEGVDASAFDELSRNLRYAVVDYDDPSSFGHIKEGLGGAEHPVHYVALPPEVFQKVAVNLAKVGLAKGSRLVLEKPFGHDGRSASELADALHESFAEDAIFRIDHFLGKEPVENIVYFRAANPIFESSFHEKEVESVQITMAETFGVKGRAKFYDSVGAVRDVVQNHMFEVIACLAMDLPSARGHEALRGARSRLISQMKALGNDDIVRGQVRGYKDEEGVDKSSTTETFAAIRLAIDSPRWRGVPFFIRVGKSLAVTATEAVVRWKPGCCPVLEDSAAAPANDLRFRLGPDTAIALGTNVKKEGRAMVGERRELVLHRGSSEALQPYERLLGDAIDGDPSLFARMDAVLDSWRVVDPVGSGATPVHVYEPGSWGPAEAARIAPPGGWYDPA
jgi:glucose-6-phosphate 1-dehydrogenase